MSKPNTMDYTCKIKKIIDETHDVKTFQLDKPADYKFMPGYHAILGLPDLKIKRFFTISSSPLSDTLNFTIKLNKEFTHTIFNKKIGDDVIVGEPRGKGLIFKDEYTEPLLLLAVGSGIAPFMSLIEYLIDKESKQDVVLLLGNKTHSDIIFKDRLDSLPDNFRVVYIISREEAENKGHVDEEMILKHVPDLRNRRWFACGIPVFVKSIDKVAEKYVNKGLIHSEFF